MERVRVRGNNPVLSFPRERESIFGKEGSGLQWILTKGEAKEILSKGKYWVHPGCSLNSGVFSIGLRRNWLYSKQIPEPNLLDLDFKKSIRKSKYVIPVAFKRNLYLCKVHGYAS
jgi:hypothetical protein